MSGIIQILIKNHVFFLFIFLECVSFKVFISNNFVAESKLSKKMTTVRSSFFVKEQTIKDYFFLRKKNEELLKSNALLISKNLLLNQKIEAINKQIAVDRDTLLPIITQAKIVRNSWNKKNNFMTINSGEKSSIGSNMGVVNQMNNLVGITHTTTKHFSTIISLLNTQLMISAKIKNTGHYGTLSWNGNDPNTMQLSDVPKHAEFKIGDTIITSGYSNILPSNINIGHIAKYHPEENTNFLKISVNLFVDFTNIENVYIVHPLFKSERDSVEHKSSI